MIDPVVLQLSPQETITHVISNIIRFVPRLLYALAVLAIGIIVSIVIAGRVQDAVEDSDVLADGLAAPAASGTKYLLYFFTVTIALAAVGLNVGVLIVFMEGLAFGLGAAVGIVLAWTYRDELADYVEGWIDTGS